MQGETHFPKRSSKARLLRLESAKPSVKCGLLRLYAWNPAWNPPPGGETLPINPLVSPDDRRTPNLFRGHKSVFIGLSVV